MCGYDASAFIDCRLVHADLSEFNMLWQKKELWVIDLAQGVEWDHPNALRFLRDDCQHVTSFFRKRGLSSALSVRALFEFVTAEQPRDLAVEMSKTDETTEAEDNVWFQAFLPQRLSQIKDPMSAVGSKDNFHGDLLMDEESSSDDDDEEYHFESRAFQPPRVEKAAPPTKQERKDAKRRAKKAQREKREKKSSSSVVE